MQHPDRSEQPRLERLHGVDVVAERLGISVKTVRRMISRGELKSHRVGRLLRVSEVDFQVYLKERRRP